MPLLRFGSFGSPVAPIYARELHLEGRYPKFLNGTDAPDYYVDDSIDTKKITPVIIVEKKIRKKPAPIYSEPKPQKTKAEPKPKNLVPKKTDFKHVSQ